MEVVWMIINRESSRKEKENYRVHFRAILLCIHKHYR